MKTKYLIKGQFVFPDEILSITQKVLMFNTYGLDIHYLSGAQQIIVFNKKEELDNNFDYIMKISKQSANEIQCFII